MAKNEDKPNEQFAKLVSDAAAEIPGGSGGPGDSGTTPPAGGGPGSDAGTGPSRHHEDMRKLVNDGLATLENLYVQALQHRLERAGCDTGKALDLAKRGLATGPLRNRLPDYLAEGLEEILAIQQIDWKTGLVVCAGAMALQMGPHWLLVNREVREMEKANAAKVAPDGPVDQG